MNKIQILATQAAAGAAVITLDLGFSWISTGYGLHPVAAGALALALILTPLAMPARVKVEG